MEAKKNLLTYAGLKKLEDELHDLKVVKRKEVAEKIKEAREQGDLSENAEYDAAKDEQRDIELRIEEIEKILKNAEVVVEDEVDEGKINVGCKVKVLDMEYDEEMDLLLQHFAAYKCTDRSCYKESGKHGDKDSRVCGRLHGVDIALLGSISQHGLCPALGISEENKVRPCSAQGEKDIGQAVDFLALVLLCTGDKIRYDGHNEIAQRKRPVHTGDKPDDGHYNAHDRDTPALMYFCDHQQINRPGKQSTPGGHEKGQHRVGSKKDATHHDEYEQKCGENPCCY